MIKFTSQGHENILSLHKNTLEVTSEKNISRRADCIVAVSADFNILELKDFVNAYSFASLTLKVAGFEEKICFQVNKNFCDGREIVIRKSNFESDRTFGVYADKSSLDFSREFVEKLKNPLNIISVEIVGVE